MIATADPLAIWMADCRARVDATLHALLPPASDPASRLNDACHYAIRAGGKRIRPLLVYAASELAGANQGDADIPAAAVELLHTYSLVHDDLPAMDDDDLRRGRPTCHKAFGEATAILAGDSLHTLAFQVLAEADTLPESTRLALIRLLTRAAGTQGMAAGQMLDMDATGRSLAIQQLEQLHRLKTGRLITASLLMGGCAAGADQQTMAMLQVYGDAVGLAFQIHDDILDVTTGTDQLGKPGGSDTRHGKNTFPALLGLAESQRRARLLCDEACSAVSGHGGAPEHLIALARYIIERSH